MAQRMKQINFFLKSKVGIALTILSFVLLTIFLFVSFQINPKISQYLNQKIEKEVLAFEKENGLEVEWQKLNFNIFLFRVKLKDVTISSAQNKISKKNFLLEFFNGPQFLNEIYVRPSVIHFLLKKKLHISSLTINKGDLKLKLASFAKRPPSNQKKSNWPVKRIVIKNTDLILQHKENKIHFSKIKLNVKKIKNNIYKFSNKIEKVSLNTQAPFRLKSKGIFSENNIKFQKASIKNKETQLKANSLEFLFDKKGVHTFQINSEGGFPSALLQEALFLFNKKDLRLNGLLSHKLKLSFKRKKGYKGNFEIEGKFLKWRHASLLKVFTQGRILRDSIVWDKGFIETSSNSKIHIKKANFFYRSNKVFHFLIQTQDLPFSFLEKNLFEQPLTTSLIKGNFSSLIDCSGKISSNLHCEAKTTSPEIKLQTNNETLLQAYNTNNEIMLDWKPEALSFKMLMKKEDSTQLNLSGSYNTSSKNLFVKLDGFFQLKTDIYFPSNPSLFGSVQVKKGRFKIKDDKFSLNSSIFFPNISISNYEFKNTRSLLKINDEKLSFLNIKGQTGKTVYTGNASVYFKKQKIKIRSQSSFFDIKDLKQILGKNISKWNLAFSGTGSGQLSLTFNKNQQPDFKVKGHLFNAQIDKEFFKTIDFDISFEKSKGLIQKLFLKKGKGWIDGKGTFDPKFELDVNLTGSHLPLEGIHFLNSQFPFNQSGEVSFSGKVKGPLNNPEFKGKAQILNTVFYTYPVNKSSLDFSIDKTKLSLSGHLMNALYIDKFSYNFKKSDSLYIKGRLNDWDFSKLILAKNKKENSQEFKSQVNGAIELSLSKKETSGHVEIKNISVFRGKKWIKNEQPFSIKIANKKWNISPVTFSHYNNKKLKIENLSLNKQKVEGYTYLDLWSLWLPFLDTLEGTAEVDFSISKNIKAAKPKGKILLTKGLLSLPFLPEFTDIQSQIELNNNQIFINKLTSLSGGGQVQGKGQIFYDYTFTPPEIQFNLNFKEAQINIPKGFYSKGTGALTISGNKPPYLMALNYKVNSGNILKDWSDNQTDDLNSLLIMDEVKKEESLFYLNLKIKTTNPIFIKNSIIRAPITGSLSIYGQPKELLMKGLIQLTDKTNTPGFISFRGHDFKIMTGNLSFDNSAPDNPTLDIQAQTIIEEKEVTNNLNLNNEQKTSETYRILLKATGPAKNLKISLNSSPSLNEKEIISLLAFGVGSRRFNDNSDFTQYSYQLLGSYLLQKPLGKELRNTLDLDLNIAPHMNKKSNKPVTKVTLKKNWFEKLQTSFSRTIEETSSSDIRVKYNLKKNVSLTAFWEEDSEDNFVKEGSTEKDRLGVDFEFSFGF